MQNECIPVEIERKFLIKYPDIREILRLPGVAKREIVQTYLLCDTGALRVRKTVCDGKIRYVATEKRDISDVTRYEKEWELSKDEYNRMLLLRDETRVPIEKTRYVIPCCTHVFEVDIYKFWNDRAIMEIELSEEDEQFTIPEFLEIIKEVTSDKRYSNAELAKQVINEKL